MLNPFGAFNTGNCKRKHGLTPSTRLERTRAPPASIEGEKGQSSIKDKADVRMDTFQAPVSLSGIRRSYFLSGASTNW